MGRTLSSSPRSRAWQRQQGRCLVGGWPPPTDAYSYPICVYSCTMTVLTTPSPAIATAGIAGSSGYAGRELHRLLASHPRLAAAACTADTRALVESDIVFLALPHGASGEIASELASARVPVVDLSADLRAEWQYGLPELHRVAIAKSGAVANPGCYATAALLALAPLVEAGAIESHVVVDGKSGVSGAGKKPTDANPFCAAAEGIAPYAAVGHHHQLEIEQQLSAHRRRSAVGHLHAPPGAVHARAAGDRVLPRGGADHPGRAGRPVPRPLRRRAVRQLLGRRPHAVAARHATSARSRPGSIPSGAR